jgi:hypothetical protein
MNNKGQIPIDPRIGAAIVGIFFLVVLAPILLGAIGDTFNQLFCEEEKGDIATLQNQVSDLQQKNQNLADLLAQCQAEHDKTKEECERQINQTVAECNVELNKIDLILNHYTINFWIFSISLTFTILFGISLFDIKISFGKRVDKMIRKYEDLWTFIEWAIFVIFIIAVIITFLNLAFKLGILF